MGRENRGSGKFELKVTVIGFYTVICFVVFRVFFYIFCFGFYGNFGGIESRYSIYYIL